MVAVIAGMILVAGCNQLDQRVEQVKDAVESGEYGDAAYLAGAFLQDEELTEEDLEQFEAAIQAYLGERLSDLHDQYKAEEIDEAEVNERVDPVLSVLDDPGEEAESYASEINVMKEARHHLHKGETLMEKNWLQAALEEFQKIDDKAEDEFAQAQVLYEEIQPNLWDEVKGDVATDVDNGMMQAALRRLDEVSEWFEDHAEWDELHDQIYETEVIKGLSKVEDLLADESYRDALEKLEELSAYGMMENELDEMINETEAVIQAQDEETKARLQSAITEYYDDVTGDTIYVPEGHSTQYVDIVKNQTSFYPRIVESGSIAYFTIVAGFGQDDWVFFDTLIFNADGRRFRWDLPYFDRGSDVGGGVFEWYILSELTVPSIMDDLEVIRSSEEVQVRFQGNGFRDYTLTKEDQQKIEDMLDFYYLNEFEGLSF
ncbi:hypothetical protein Bsel_0209 [[Bacillus] selenitireducens MLS10]|uniref:Uncharacterized protein n=2 Tax=Salisediminibacterium selenitireducens TaxID=85683 RepID=D6XVY2_BACIE|nr:hypothetical protein Bsel_0209 [[Bacillus] selenitireducens MLS10]